MPLQKQDGGLYPSPHPLGEIWGRCFANLPANATPVRNESAKIFTSTYDNFIQTAIRDGASTAPNFSRGFMILLTPPMLLVLTLKSSTRLTYLMPLILYAALSHLMYSVGMLPLTKLVVSNTRTLLSPLIQHVCYFHAMRTCHAKLRYFDWEGHVHFAIVCCVACKVPAGPGAGRLLILTMGTSKAR
jgi:hypothetical protein